MYLKIYKLPNEKWEGSKYKIRQCKKREEYLEYQPQK
jgi:hypothetical protein